MIRPPNPSSPGLDLLTEDLIPLSDVPREFPCAARPHLSAIYRWCHVGVSGHRLETVRVGKKTYTSREAVHRFLVATQS